MDQAALDRVDSTVFAAIADSAFPGAQLVAVRDNAIVLDRAYGRQTYDTDSPPVSGRTLFDIASVTKAVATTAALMRLFDEGKVGLDDRAGKFLPALDSGGKASITVEHLLRHRAGFPPFRTYFLTCTTAAQTLDSVYATPLVAKPGDSTIYSDFGFVVLGKIVEAVTGSPLDRYVDSVFYTPLGMTRTMFLPPAELRDSVAPTEYDSLYRRRLVRGEVHDENAFALGGVSGHAGLFSTAEELAVLMQMLMNGGSYGSVRYLRAQTVALFTGRSDPAQERGLGWDFVSTSGYTSAGKFFGPLSYGHTGFTGTSVWADPQKKIFIILLTNRVFPTRNNNKIRNVRPAVHDAVMRAIGPR
jgi:CubicO group peptidase (beta-lactamase class C family)